MNDYNKASKYVSTVGFCTRNCDSGTIYISNDSIKGFKISESIIANKYCIIMISNYEQYVIYSCDNKKCYYDEFKLLANKIVKRILDCLKYDASQNIDIDKIINEVIPWKNID